MTEFCIRPFKLEDKETYLDMAGDFYGSDATLTVIPRESFVATFEEVTSDSQFLHGYIIEVEGEIAGYFLLAMSWYNELLGKIVNFEEVYICEKYRSCGIGSRVIDWVRKNYSQYKAIRLELCPSNPRAGALYERLGFEKNAYFQMFSKI